MTNELTKDQKNAITQLTRSLNKCHKVGLKGGVYDNVFCVWPIGTYPEEPSGQFFESVLSVGDILDTDMYLDGGAGV